MKRNSCRVTVVAFLVALGVLGSSPVETAQESSESADSINQVLEWNQVFIDTLIATNTANSSSQRLGAIFHTAIFDAYNGIERRYTPIRVDSSAPRGASRRAAVIAAAYTAIVGLFPSLTQEQRTTLDDKYAASLAALSDDGGDGGQSRERGITWGVQVASMVLAWRATDGFVRNPPYPPFSGGLAVGQWRPTGGSCVAMSGLGLAFTAPFVVVSPVQFDPGPPRSLASHYADDFNSVKALGRQTGSTRTDDQTALAPFWEGNASVHWNQAANQMARAHQLSLSDSNRLLAGTQHRDGGHGIHHLERQAVLRRGSPGGDLASGHRDPVGRDGRQSADGAGSRLETARHDAVPPRVSCRPPRSEWSGGDRSPQPVR